MENSTTEVSGRYRLIRTLRVRTDNVPGVLGAWASAIGTIRANIGNLQTVQIGHHYIIRDVEILVDNEHHLQQVLQEMADIKGVSVLEVRDDVLDLHRGGKIQMISRQPIDSLDRLRKVYTPGVADVCRKIVEDQSQRDLYTCIPNLVAIVTDGTRVLGLGNIGPFASMPVMEGKSAILSELVGLSGVPILLDITDPQEIINTVKHIAPTFGAIQLEDIASPRCFEISERLSKELPIPVMHDDQDGTGVVALAAILKACKNCDIDLGQATIGQIGLGAAGMGIAEMIQHYTGKAVLGSDIVLDRVRRLEARGGIGSTLQEIMAKARIVVATTGVKNLISKEMVRPGQVIFALTNPEPEIWPSVALAQGAALAADGRSVNNMLGFPGIWRGALDCKASKITREMLVAASMALTNIGGPTEFLPSPLDKGVHKAVARGVARAALSGGVARKSLDEDYFESA